MHRGIQVVVDQALAHEDGVLVVVSLPRHVGDQDVLTESDFTALAGRTISQHLADNHRIALTHDRTLVQAGVLVGTLILLQEVGVIHALFVPHHDCRGIHERDGSVDPEIGTMPESRAT